MTFRIFFLRFIIPHHWMKHPLRLGIALGASAFTLSFVLLDLLPFLQGKAPLSGGDFAACFLFGALVFLFSTASAAAQNRKIRKMRERYVDEDTLLYETTIREYTELIQVNKFNLTGELFLSAKRLQYFPHASNIRPDPTFNRSLEDIQSAEVAYIRGRRRPVLAIHRQDETAYFVVNDPEKWAGKINQAIAAIRANEKEDD